ncbi:hypothetical protein Cni_G16226 [Canna indica]|uniref:FAE domain-containing protein n=1 Tax=Canna indica TaxID=4628 RepID=A0AAQ3QE07_9LILI|nr:hypothetical protein Cni_G16226 [Canna indica]
MPSSTSDLVLHPNLILVVFSVLWCTLLALLAHLSTRPRPVLLLDYSCFLLDIDRKCRFEVSQYIAHRSHHYTQKSEDFMRGILLKSGLSDETYVPASFHTHYEPSLRSGFQEAEEVMTLTVDARPSTSSSSSTSIVIVSCGMFTPAPSLSSSLLVHRFALNIEDCKQVKAHASNGLMVKVTLIFLQKVLNCHDLVTRDMQPFMDVLMQLLFLVLLVRIYWQNCLFGNFPATYLSANESTV